MQHIQQFIPDDQGKILFETLKAKQSWMIWPPSPKSRKVCKLPDSQIPKNIREIMISIETRFGTTLEPHIFLNLYMSGEDYCPYHADQYGVDTYTLSLGGIRDFLVKPNSTGTKATKYVLKNGDLYSMKKEIHTTYKHSIPKRKTKVEPRISILFFSV